MSEGLSKVAASAAEAIAGIGDGATIAAGGFGLCGIPSTLIAAVLASGARDLHVVSNNCGVDDWGLGLLLAEGRIARMTASYVGENAEFARQYLAGELEVELVPQGTLAERLRAGGVGIPAFYTPTGVGTMVADGGVPWRYHPDGSVARSSPVKETRRFVMGAGEEEVEYVLEPAIVCDFALVRAWRGDETGNLVYRLTARNFNPLCAMAARITVAEVEHLVRAGEIDPVNVHTAGVFVNRVVEVDAADEKRIEKRTVQAATTPGAP